MTVTKVVPSHHSHWPTITSPKLWLGLYSQHHIVSINLAENRQT